MSNSFKRLFDILMSLIGLITLLPLFVLLAIFIVLDSKGSVFYCQKRIGLYQSNFKLIKFRTMQIGADGGSLLTVGSYDQRITKFGYWLRKYKIDELPQLWNILKGEMSFVGPRPEVGKYVALYTKKQKQILNLKPGLTDWASLKYINENQLLADQDNPEEYYIQEIIPNKIEENLKYLNHHNLYIDLKIILLTIKKLIYH
jgi:lipopolysaccharide/colanic/teichoic acid biosynthesis glycosyltransferase